MSTPMNFLRRLKWYISDDHKHVKLLLAQHDNLFVTRITAVGRDIFEHVALPPIIKSINALVYNPVNNSVIISDIVSKIIFEWKFETQVCNILVEKDVVNVTLMDIGMSLMLIKIDLKKY